MNSQLRWKTVGNSGAESVILTLVFLKSMSSQVLNEI